MKTGKFLFIAIMALFLGSNNFAQIITQPVTTKTETLKVWGNCDMCKTRIEKAAKLDGVSSADWDKGSKLLTVSYNPSKTSIDAICNKIAEVGHDTEKYKADDKVYNSLPACCKYERTK